MKRLAILVVPLAAAILVSCEDPLTRSDQQLAIHGAKIMPPKGGAHPKDGSSLLIVRLLVASVEAPLGTISDTEQLWSYLDENPVRVIGSGDLGLNGIRVGIGRRETWEDVAGVLKEMTGKVLRQKTVVAPPGNAVRLTFQKTQPARVIFLVYADRTLTGGDFPQGDHILTVGLTVAEDDPSKVMLTVVPQILSTRRDTKIVKHPGGYAVVEKPNLYTFEPLTFQLSVTNDDFVVIGPNSESRRPTSVGHGLFIRRKQGLAFETVFVLSPRLVTQKSR